MKMKIFPIFRQILKNYKIVSPLCQVGRNISIYEPDYLESLKPKFPQYESINFQITGYDFPILENYQKFLHSAAEYLNMDVSDCWALPPKHLQVQRFKPASAIIDSEYKLTVYQRNLQVSDLEAPMYPLYLRIAQAALPEGVTLNVLEHSPDLEELRYVPDRDLKELKTQLESMQNVSKKK